MSRGPSQSTRLRARRAAPSPAVAGFRPHGAALAVAFAFALYPLVLRAQPSGANVIHGQGTFVRNGSNLVVTTQNGAGSNHSAINWQSFSVPAGSVTQFVQPSATSTSINRVVGPDPSAIFGTLSSNGRLVLVNPAGIAVGKGAVVDTAGFTASTLKMSDADAVAGRLAFGGDSAGALQVDGHVIARSGDVVLIGASVQTGSEALIQSNGATVLAAGQKVEITGRGLEGIRMEVQAGDRAVNLGTLQGDAVGIFAGTLKHSGLVSAQAVSTEGGKVVLKATGGDALVGGTISASRGERGGSVAVFGEQVGLTAGAKLQASGVLGGGSVRVGGDYQGANAEVPNARRTYVDAQASITADALQQGDGGRVIVWADEVTRMHGQVSARGGEQGGDGGFAEVSGKQHLDFTGRADLRAPQGRAGTLLLDPEDIVIFKAGTGTRQNHIAIATADGADFTSTGGPYFVEDSLLVQQLAFSNLRVTTSNPSNTGTGGQITLNADANVTWTTANNLELRADKGITLGGIIQAAGGGSVALNALGGDIVQQSTSKVSAANVKASAKGSMVLSALDASGTFSARDAGSVTLVAGGSITGGSVIANGYSPDMSTSETGAGGNGGAVSLMYGGSLLTSVSAAGGNGNGGTNSNGSDGGSGGSITVTATGGPLLLNGTSLVANGGAGSSAAAGTTGVAGIGGNGGTVVLRSAGDKVEFRSAYVNALGGYSDTSPGAMGNLVVTAGTSDITGTFLLDAIWNNGATINVSGAGYVYDFGKVVNSGQLNLTGNVFVKPSGGVENLAGASVTVNSGDPYVYLTQNAGTVKIAAGGSLTAPTLISNAGVVYADGTLYAGQSSSGCTGTTVCKVTTSPTFATFVNKAGGMLSGSGSIVVGGGSGVLDNYGTIAPGEAGSIGTLTLDGSLVMQEGSTLAVDLLSPTSHDTLMVTGMAVTGGTVASSYQSGYVPMMGSSFLVLQAGGGVDASTMPTSSAPELTPTAGANDLSLVLATAAATAPAPAIQQVQSQVVSFSSEFVEGLEKQQEDANPIGKDDIVVTETACAPT